MAAVAMHHRINANVVRKWLPRHRDCESTVLTTMLPVNITPASVAVSPRPRLLVAAAPRAPIELILNDATVRLPAGFDPAELHSIVQILAALR